MDGTGCHKSPICCYILQPVLRGFGFTWNEILRLRGERNGIIIFAFFSVIKEKSGYFFQPWLKSGEKYNIRGRTGKVGTVLFLSRKINFLQIPMNFAKDVSLIYTLPATEI